MRRGKPAPTHSAIILPSLHVVGQIRCMDRPTGAHRAPYPWRQRLAALVLLCHAGLRAAGAALPGRCALCGATGTHVLCTGCRQQFGAAAAVPRCPVCAEPVAEEATPTPCGRCLILTPAFDATVCAVDYAAPFDQLVLGLKFGARLAHAPVLAALLRDALLQNPRCQQTALPELLAAVPLGRVRLRERGFNQALEIARPLAALMGTPLAPRLLVRQRDTKPQSLLTPEQRRHNLHDAFALTPSLQDAVRDRHVGVIDDVMTTGATLDAIATVLKQYGAARVTNLVVARTAPP